MNKAQRDMFLLKLLWEKKRLGCPLDFMNRYLIVSCCCMNQVPAEYRRVYRGNTHLLLLIVVTVYCVSWPRFSSGRAKVYTIRLRRDFLLEHSYIISVKSTR